MNTILLLCLVLIAAVTLSYFVNKEGFTNSSRVNTDIAEAQQDKKDTEDKLKTATTTAAVAADEYKKINDVVIYLNSTDYSPSAKLVKALEELTKIKTQMDAKRTSAATASTTATNTALTAASAASEATSAAAAAQADPDSTAQLKKSKNDIKAQADTAAGKAAAAATAATAANEAATKASADFTAANNIVTLLSSTTSTQEQKIQAAKTYLIPLNENAKEKMNAAAQAKLVANLQATQATKILDKVLSYKLEEDEMEKTRQELTNKKHVQTSSAAPPSKTDIVPDTDISEIGQDAKELHQKSELIKDIQKVVRNEILAVRNTTPVMNNESCQEENESDCGNTAATNQGKEYTSRCNKDNSCSQKPDMAQYIKKNSIPCWGCSLDY